MKIEHPTAPRLLLAVLTLVVVFGLGVVAGLGVAHLLRPPPPPDFLARDPDAILPPFDRLGLSAGQKIAARAIVARHAAAMEDALQDAFPRMRAVRLQLDADMRTILTPTQNRQFDAFLASHPPMPGEPR
jgi:hypothetical protein